MSGSLLGRALGLLERLAEAPDGESLQALADSVTMPKSGCHRLLSELVERGYVVHDVGQRYRLTSKLVTLGFRHLNATGVVDLAQPTLDQLALESRELVRLGVIDGDQQVWVGRAQGAQQGLRFDPEMGGVVPLAHTASGHAWLMHLTPERAASLVLQQGFASAMDAGPKAPRSLQAVQKALLLAQRRGYAVAHDWSAAGTSALAAAVFNPRTGAVVGTVSVAGPSIRVDEQRMTELAPTLLEAAAALGYLLPGSPPFSSASTEPTPSIAKPKRVIP